MAEPSGNFSRESARRIAKVTRRVEGTPWNDLARGSEAPPPATWGFRRFKLKTALSGASATAYLLKSDGSGGWEADEAVEFTVSDASELRHAPVDAVGVCCRPFDSAEWEIISVACYYERCTVLLKGAMVDTDATHTVDNVSPICGMDPTVDAATELTVYNTHDWDGDDNAPSRIEYNKTTGHWELYQVTCPA